MDTEGIKHHYAKLALFTFVGGGLEGIIDCRDFFPPLNTLDDLSLPPPETKSKSLIYWVHGTICEVEFPEKVPVTVSTTAWF